MPLLLAISANAYNISCILEVSFQFILIEGTQGKSQSRQQIYFSLLAYSKDLSAFLLFIFDGRALVNCIFAFIKGTLRMCHLFGELVSYFLDKGRKIIFEKAFKLLLYI